MDKSKIVLGTQVSSQEGWEERAKALCNPDDTVIEIRLKDSVVGQLTTDEWKRLIPKMKMVKEAAQYMVAGMIKGTIKYPSDDYSIDTWMAHLIGEGADQMNYQILLANAWKHVKEKI